MTTTSQSDTKQHPPRDYAARDAVVAHLQAHAAEVRATLEQGDRDNRWLCENSPRLVEEYPDEWVAVFDEKLVAHDPDLPALIEKIRALGLKPEHAMVERMESDPIPRIL